MAVYVILVHNISDDCLKTATDLLGDGKHLRYHCMEVVGNFVQTNDNSSAFAR